MTVYRLLWWNRGLWNQNPFDKIGLQGKIPHPSDRPEFGYAAIGFFIPLVGLILYLVWRAEYPLRARSCGKGALSAVIFWLCLAVGTILIAAILLPMCYVAAPLFLL